MRTGVARRVVRVRERIAGCFFFLLVFFLVLGVCGVGLLCNRCFVYGHVRVGRY